MNFERSSGILLHPTSLPGKFGIGTLGKEAYDFIDFLKQSGQKLWQTCPLGPTGYGNSPYQCFSAFAGNPLLISIESLQMGGLLTDKDINSKVAFDDCDIDYGKLIEWKFPILKKAFENFKKQDPQKNEDYQNFCKESEFWLEDYVLFIALKDHFQKPWFEWDKKLKHRDEAELKKYSEKLADDIDYQKFLQYEFYRQWEHVKKYANENNVKIIGDIPLYVAHDSSDAWSHYEIFQFDVERDPTSVAGVPPDYFSETGQRWGNPLFDWNALQRTGYNWWIERVKANLRISDIIRIDHFRALSAYWSIPADEELAINGSWQPAYGHELFETLLRVFGKLPILAEDLGHITDDVHELRDRFELPGMKILQFAFYTDDSNIYLPHNYHYNSICYTGTHDNDTVVGWYMGTSGEVRHKVRSYMQCDGDNVAWDFIETAWKSSSIFAIAPLQDLLELGADSRMNTPGKESGNWSWRYSEKDLSDKLKLKLFNSTERHHRL